MWYGGWGGGWGISWIFFIFLAVFLSRVFWGGWGWGWRRRYWRYGGGGPYGHWGDDPGHAEDILRERLARGEIDQAEYERLLEVLRRRP
ncbi:MAG: SHOCT domain-containing protein [Thermaerobacter sp.]|nr:SHOCT domain-containing protein [Thermaerobacter sp.]